MPSSTRVSSSGSASGLGADTTARQTIPPDTGARPRHRGAGQVVLGLAILVVIGLLGLVAPLVAPSDPARIDMLARLKPPSWTTAAASAHALGTDHLGRDVLSRTIYGAQVSFIVGLSAVLGSGALGVVLGLVAGFYPGWLDDVIMRVADVQQSFPYLALAIAVVAALGPGLGKLILILAITGWVLYARVVRAEALSLREKDFVEAARALGASDLGIIARHILPNLLSSVIIIATFNFAYFIIAEASLTFLGLGLAPSTSSWGTMLSDSRNYLHVAWWYPTFPGLALMLTVMGANLLGDGLRDLWDPRMRSSA
jgi:peptide/nickel transport system permease protein